MRIPLALLLALASACRPDGDDPDRRPTDGPDPGDTGAPPSDEPWPLLTLAEDAEIVLDSPADAVVPAGEGFVGVWGGERRWITARGDEVLLGPGKLPRAAAEHAGALWWLDDEGVRVRVGDELLDAGLGPLLPGAPTGLRAGSGALWIPTAGGLCVWRDEVLSLVTVDGEAVDGPIAPGGRLYGEDVTWIAQGDRLHALAGNGAAWAVFETTDLGGPVEGVAVDGDRALATAGGRLFVREGGAWRRQDLPTGVHALLGGPRGTWGLTREGPLFVGVDELVEPSTLATEGRWLADDLGRLLVRTPSDVRRVSVHRPLQAFGVSAGDVVDATRAIELVPTAPAQVTELTAALESGSGAPLPLPVEAGVATLDPAEVPPGAWTFVALAAYADREPSRVEVAIEVRPPGGVTWEEHVGPIHEGTCAVCHADSATTVLDGPESWEAHIDDILLVTGSGAMPLGGPPLESWQVALVQAWKDGGFLP